MKRFKDRLGHVYEVPDDRLREFEAARTGLLIAAILGQVFFLVWILGL